jgi:hypothetical protein
VHVRKKGGGDALLCNTLIKVRASDADVAPIQDPESLPETLFAREHLAPIAGTILGGLGSAVWVGRSFWRKASLDDAATALADYKLSKNVDEMHPC